MMTGKKKFWTEWTCTEKIIFIICQIIIVASVLSVVYAYRYSIVKLYYKNHDIQALNLTLEQKLEDFEYYYGTMVSSFPMLETYNDVLKYNFVNKKEYFRKMVASTKSDYEFYCVMCSISNEFPSYHTDIVFPQYKIYETLGCYNMTHTLCNETVYPASIYWNELLQSKYESIHDVTYYNYTYVDGEYILLNKYNDYPEGTRLTEINGTDIDNYVFENQFTNAAKKYDTVYGNIYVNKLCVNNRIGESVKLTLVLPDGNTVYEDAYRGVCADTGAVLYNAYNEKRTDFPSVADKNVYSSKDDKNNIGYIKIGSMGYIFKDDIANELCTINKCKSVIIDLRDNYGGSQIIGEEYIYPNVFSSNTNVRSKWYMIDSPNNQCVKNENLLRNISTLRFKSADDVLDRSNYNWLCSYRNFKYEGKADFQPDIYILVNSETGSAADGFTSAMKNHSAVTVIGENTAGEGLADSFICDYLPNSGLVFIYMYGQAFNPDGTDNSLYGTSPDVYVNLSVENFNKRFEIENNSEDPYTYENRLKWDNVLIETLEIIKEKENTK